MIRELTASVYFFVGTSNKTYAFRALPFAPRVGETIVFNDTDRFVVKSVHWHFTEKTDRAAEIHVIMTKRPLK